jgi:hypothetical protein
MRKLSLALCSLLLLTSMASPSANDHAADAAPAPDHALDVYGNICWEDEKARLDNFAIALQNNPDTFGLIIVYAGRRSCSGEAEARAARAKAWVEGRGVAAERVMWKDGGYREGVMTWLWLVPRDLDKEQWPSGLPELGPHEVKVFRRCKGKIYRPAKCDEP